MRVIYETNQMDATNEGSAMREKTEKNEMDDMGDADEMDG